MKHLRDAVAVIAASLLLGGLTSWAQGFLPDAVNSFANSPSGWTALTAVLVAALRPRLVWAAVLGVASFLSLLAGYTIASELRGLTYDPFFWGVAGVIAGPFVGMAAAAVVGKRPVLAALGAGALAGVLVADGVYGLTVVAESTSPVYWTICLVLGAALVVGTAWRLRSARLILVLLATVVLATGVPSLGYDVFNDLAVNDVSP